MIYPIYATLAITLGLCSVVLGAPLSSTERDSIRVDAQKNEHTVVVPNACEQSTQNLKGSGPTFSLFRPFVMHGEVQIAKADTIFCSVGDTLVVVGVGRTRITGVGSLFSYIAGHPDIYCETQIWRVVDNVIIDRKIFSENTGVCKYP